MGGVWCAMSAAIIVGHFVPQDHKFTPIHCTHSDTVFGHLSNYERTLFYFSSSSAVQLTLQQIFALLRECFW